MSCVDGRAVGGRASLRLETPSSESEKASTPGIDRWWSGRSGGEGREQGDAPARLGGPPGIDSCSRLWRTNTRLGARAIWGRRGGGRIGRSQTCEGLSLVSYLYILDSTVMRASFQTDDAREGRELTDWLWHRRRGLCSTPSINRHSLSGLRPQSVLDSAGVRVTCCVSIKCQRRCDPVLQLQLYPIERGPGPTHATGQGSKSRR